jgi:hypothetical protein
LERLQALPEAQIASVRKAIQSAEKSHMNEKKVAGLKDLMRPLEAAAATAKTPADSARMQALADILQHPAA